MSNIIEGRFVQKEERVYNCHNCSSQKFWIDYAGTVTCYDCKQRQLPPVDWFHHLADMIKEKHDLGEFNEEEESDDE